LRWLLRGLRFFQGSLRAKFLLAIVGLEVALLGSVAVILESHLRTAIFAHTRSQAVSLGTHLAALSAVHLSRDDLVALQQVAEKVTADEPDVLYSIVHRRDGSVAAFSGQREFQGGTHDDPVSQRALLVIRPLLQEITFPVTAEPGYDVAIPIQVAQSQQQWGTLRLGVSLKRAYTQIQQTRQKLLVLTLAGIVCGALLAVWLARRIARPLRQLVAEAQHLAEGSYDRPIQVDAGDELGDLALAFEHMRRSLQCYLSSLADEKDLLQEAHRRIQRTQQQLIQTERLAAVGKLAAGVAHEINNPLAIIRTSIRILQAQTQENDPAMETLKVIEEEINRASRIIRELLGFARPTPTSDVVAINAVVCGLEDLLKDNLHTKKIVPRIILAPGLPQVQISADHLKQVILNLVRNAEDAMPEGGELIIRTALKQDAVELSIADTGCGISAENLGRLFDPFFSTKAPGKGTGLGLSVSYGLVTGANGHIDVESEVGKGTTFRVQLPAYEP